MNSSIIVENGQNYSSIRIKNSQLPTSNSQLSICNNKGIKPKSLFETYGIETRANWNAIFVAGDMYTTMRTKDKLFKKKKNIIGANRSRTHPDDIKARVASSKVGAVVGDNRVCKFAANKTVIFYNPNKFTEYHKVVVPCAASI